MTDELHERFDRLQHEADGDWGDVLSRAARLRGRRRMIIAAVIGAVVAVAAPTALALQGSIVDFFQSEAAPPSMVLDFERMDEGAPPHLDNRVIYGETRKIFERRISDGRMLTLWVAPNRRGGFCMALSGPRHEGGFGCLWANRPPISTSQEIRGPVTPEGVIKRGPFLVWGTVEADEAETIEMVYEDGERERQPLTWVSEPIGAAFFMFEITKPHWVDGHRIDELVVRDGDGTELSSDPLPYRLPRPVPQASTRD